MPAPRWLLPSIPLLPPVIAGSCQRWVVSSVGRVSASRPSDVPLLGLRGECGSEGDQRAGQQHGEDEAEPQVRDACR